MYRQSALVLVFLTLVVTMVVSQDIAGEESGRPYETTARNNVPNDSKEETIRRIYFIINGYRRNMLERRNAIKSQGRETKRNADIINSLLALPESMNEAGR